MTMSLSGGDQSQLESVAMSAISGAQRLFSSPPRLPMSDQEKQDVEKAAKDGAICLFCGGIHVGISSPACPRLASGKLNGDGVVTEFTFWNSWDASRVIFPEDVEDIEDEETE